jgi:serine protease Do
MGMRMERTGTSILLAAAALLALTLSGLAPSQAKNERTPPKLKVEPSPVNRETHVITSFAPVIKKAAPSVVNIYTTKTIKESQTRMSPFLDPLFREFFGGDPDQARPRNRREQSLGSGVIVSDEGYILTSNHVIEGADEIRVQTSSGKEMVAKLIGADAATDTAVLKVDTTGLPSIIIADSDKLEVGDVVLAIGNPFAIGQTVTMGIVSAMGRGELGILGPEGYEDFIQTDASINPGNSGGALVDAEGRLVGINTAILSRTGGNQGVGFAIPINMGRSVMERLVTEGKVTRGFLGVMPQPVTPDLAKEFNLPEATGALVGGVEDNGPAAKAGIKPGDVIVEVGGKKINDHRHLRLLVAQTPPNTEVNVKIIREGEPKNFKVKLGELPVENLASRGLRGGEEGKDTSNETLDGVEVGDIDAKSRRQFGIPAHVRGAVVTNVDPDSAAYDAGLRPGDVILELNKKTITSSEQAVELSNTAKGDRVLLRIWSHGFSHYLSVDNRKSEKKSKKEDLEKE